MLPRRLYCATYTCRCTIESYAIEGDVDPDRVPALVPSSPHRVGYRLHHRVGDVDTGGAEDYGCLHLHNAVPVAITEVLRLLRTMPSIDVGDGITDVAYVVTCRDCGKKALVQVTSSVGVTLIK